MRLSRKMSRQALVELEKAGIVYSGDNLPTDIPDNFRDFFEDFGGILHDKDTDERGLPKVVRTLAPYQYDFAELKYGFMLKCNKVGMTTSECLVDFWKLLTPAFAGFDCVLQASTDNIANELLLKLIVNIRNSVKYHVFIDDKHTSATKLTIKNPYNPKRPSHIIPVGQSMSQVYSRMQIKRIHISDPAFLTITTAQNDFFAGLFSRLANTAGDLKVEGVPGKAKSGWFWNMSQALFGYDDELYDQNMSAAEQFTDERAEFEMPEEVREVFTTMKVTIDDAVDNNVIPKSYKEFLKKTLPQEQYRRICMAEWAESQGQIFQGTFEEGGYDAGW